MGHYRSEMEEPMADKFNYALVWKLGFEPVSLGSTSSIKRCPECLCLVEGEFAVEHLSRMHHQAYQQKVDR